MSYKLRAVELSSRALRNPRHTGAPDARSVSKLSGARRKFYVLSAVRPTAGFRRGAFLFALRPPTRRARRVRRGRGPARLARRVGRFASAHAAPARHAHGPSDTRRRSDLRRDSRHTDGYQGRLLRLSHPRRVHLHGRRHANALRDASGRRLGAQKGREAFRARREAREETHEARGRARQRASTAALRPRPGIHERGRPDRRDVHTSERYREHDTSARRIKRSWASGRQKVSEVEALFRRQLAALETHGPVERRPVVHEGVKLSVLAARVNTLRQTF